MNTKTIIIAAGAVGLGLFLWKRSQPQAAPASPWVQLGASVSGVVQGFKGLFTSSPASSGYSVPDDQDNTIIPTAVARTTGALDLSASSFSRVSSGRGSLAFGS